MSVVKTSRLPSSLTGLFYLHKEFYYRGYTPISLRGAVARKIKQANKQKCRMTRHKNS